MPAEVARRALLAIAAVAAFTASFAHASERLTISGKDGTIDFAIGDSRIFRTTGAFKDWQGTLHVDDADLPRSTVEVVVRTGSVRMLDSQQTAMLKDSDFFDVEKFPEMTFRSTEVARTGDTTLRVDGNVTLRGITRPMTLAVSVTDRRPDAAPGARYAGFRAHGTIKRSEFGMTKYVDIVGDAVEISITADALR